MIKIAMSYNIARHKQPITVAILAAVAVIIFLFSLNAVWLGDDICYRFVVSDGNWILDIDHPQPVENIRDLFASQIEHYFCCNGRFLAHTLVQLFCGLLGHVWFAVFNAAAWILFLLAILRSGGAAVAPRQLLTALVMLVLSFTSLMSPTVQIGYIWMGALVLTFINVFLSRRRYKRWMLPLLFLFGALAGNSQDAYCVGVGAALIVYWFVNIRRFTVAQWIMIAGFGAGSLLLCLSPATLSRASEYGGTFAESLLIATLSLRAFYILAIVVLWRRFHDGMKWRAIYGAASFYWIVLAVCILFNALLMVKSNRQLFGVELMSIVITLRLLRRHSFSSWWIAVFGVVVALFWWFQAGRIAIQRSQLSQIERSYADSTDGTVYVDTWNSGLMSVLDYSYDLWGLNEDSYAARSLKVDFAARYPDRPQLRVYPAMLEGLDTVDMGNRAVQFPYEQGKMVIFQSKAHPARFFVERRLFNLFPAGEKEIGFSEPLKETALWRAVIIYQLAPVFYNSGVRILHSDDS